MVKTVTMKFGGTSVGESAAIEQVVGILSDSRTRTRQVVAVVSAMSGVTDLLQEGILQAATGNGTRHREVSERLGRLHLGAAAKLLGDEAPALASEVEAILDSYVRICDSVAVLGELTPRALDHALGLGERMSAPLVAAALRRRGVLADAVEATHLIVTDDRYGDATPLLEPTRASTRRQLLPLLEHGTIPVVTGYIGATVEGVSTTLGRGGSDYSAALIGASLDSDEVWIWTDVDGVMSADPRLVPEARTIEALTYREVSELAYFGAKVLHPKAIRPVVEAGIPLRVKNTFNPDHPGTLIVDQDGEGGAVKAVTAIPGVSLITVEGRGMLGVPGIAARTFGAVARAGASVLIISQASSEQSICFALPEKIAAKAVEAIRDEFEREIARRDIDRVWAQDEVTIVTVVGAGMRNTPGIAGRVFSATGESGINVIAIAQGSSECSISLAVSAPDGDGAVRAIHRLTLEGRAGWSRVVDR